MTERGNVFKKSFWKNGTRIKYCQSISTAAARVTRSIAVLSLCVCVCVCVHAAVTSCDFSDTGRREKTMKNKPN